MLVGGVMTEVANFKAGGKTLPQRVRPMGE